MLKKKNVGEANRVQYGIIKNFPSHLIQLSHRSCLGYIYHLSIQSIKFL